VVSEILTLSAGGYRDPYTYANFDSFLEGNFGKTLHELYFKPYNEMIWRTDLSQVALRWLEGKLPMPDYRQMILSNILREGEDQMVHSTFYYPKQGGSQFIIDRLSEGLTIRTDTAIEKAKLHEGQWQLNGEWKFDAVIYTGDVRKLAHLLTSASEVEMEMMKLATRLPSNGTSNMLCETDTTDISWLYLPGPETKAHRVIYTGNFSENNNAPGRKSCVVEFSGRVSEAEIKNELPKLPGNLKPIAYNYEPNSYVIQHADSRGLIDSLKERLRKDRFFLTGRFAEWEYYNMDKAILASLRIKEAL
jgi:protoporphyrinogen oxidase